MLSIQLYSVDGIGQKQTNHNIVRLFRLSGTNVSNPEETKLT